MRAEGFGCAQVLNGITEGFIREMSLALESVCNTLGLKVIDDAATRLVAEKIIELSQHGVHGVATLHAMAVKEFKAE